MNQLNNNLTTLMINDDKIMTLEEVAEYLRVKPQTIYTWAQEKKIPAAKLGKEWRFKKSMIDQWFNESMDDKFKNYYSENT
jgi:excisionase family DNA binding protein